MVTMDVGEFEGHKFVVMLDQYSWYTKAEWVRSKQPEGIFKVLMKKWISVLYLEKYLLKMEENSRIKK